MKNFITYLIIVSLISVFSCAEKTREEAGLSSISSKTQQTLKRLADKIYATPDNALKETFGTLEKKYQILFPLLEECDKRNKINPEYLITLNEAQKALERLFRNFKTTDNKAFILKSIYLDYDAKEKSINYSIGNDANTKIKVIIDSNKEEGYFVFAKLSYEKDKDIKRFRFDGPTNNASQYFVPGYYLFWMEKDDRISDPELHLIVSNGTEEEKKLILKDPE